MNCNCPTRAELIYNMRSILKKGEQTSIKSLLDQSAPGDELRIYVQGNQIGLKSTLINFPIH